MRRCMAFLPNSAFSSLERDALFNFNTLFLPYGKPFTSRVKVFTLESGLNQDSILNSIEVTRFLESFFAALGKPGASLRDIDPKPLFKILASLKQDLPLSIPILREISNLGTGRPPCRKADVLAGRVGRIHLRMCRIQEELGRLDFRKAAAGVSAEDFIFSRIDFSRYREMDAIYFESIFPEGPDDFDEGFLKQSFGLGKAELKALIQGSYKKNEGLCKIQKETPLLLAVMRSMETSLESGDLFTAEEIKKELNDLLDFTGGAKSGKKIIPGTGKFFSLLALSLDGAGFTHPDGMETKLFISEQGKLSGTFRPAGKPWTRALIAQNVL